MGYNSFKHLNLALTINYSFNKSTIIIEIYSVIFSFYWVRVCVSAVSACRKPRAKCLKQCFFFQKPTSVSSQENFDNIYYSNTKVLLLIDCAIEAHTY